MSTIEIEKEELERRVSQLMTEAVNAEVELRLKPIRQSIKIHAFMVSAFFAAAVVVWLLYDSVGMFEDFAFLLFMFFVWMYPIWSKARYIPRWMEAHWIDLEDKEL